MRPPAPMLSDFVTFGLGLGIAVLLIVAMRWQLRHSRKTGQIFHRIAPVSKRKNPTSFRIHMVMTWLGLMIGIGLAVFFATRLVETALLFLG